MNTLRITEIFYSIQGESRSVGLPTVFVRLTGCPLRCTYCDSAYAFSGGEIKSMEELLLEVSKYRTPYVTVTGGEPLAQKACLGFMSLLCDAGYEVSLETSGALDVSQVDERVIKVMDLKTPSSGELERNLYSNLDYLSSKDQIKFVIGNREDYLWAKEVLMTRLSAVSSEVLFSPSCGELDPAELADWIIADQLQVRFQLQLHKILWGDQPGR